ncbi:phosphodiester glycosidase family protein [Sphingomonas jaspsi]|uniref:phosphodiester glycosidase family protein n=1 Tax=Sphingomonas jaspsi TaxID=392409 RepID=UPI0004B35D08|nr:phosphodiester glycosidase family protein [Sphingomonas jaspsi]
MRHVLAIVLFTLAGCEGAADQSVVQPPSPCSIEQFEGSRFTICDPGDGRVSIASGKRRLTELEVDPSTVLFAMNGGMFDESGGAIGLLVIDGKQRQPINRRRGFGNFHLLPNGVFLIRRDRSVGIVPSDRYKDDGNIAYATQSGPLLLIDGALHPKIDPDGASHYIRNAVGIAPDGTPRFVISDDAVSFGRLARFMRDRLHMENALYLDGSVSSLWEPAGNRLDNFTDLGPMIVVTKPAAGSAPHP